jgi:hypothetical protein
MESMTLLEHIQDRNAQTQAWINESPETRWGTKYTEDIEYWNECGVYTASDFDRFELIGSIHDLHKDAYGFRNRSYDFDSMTTDDLQREVDRLLDVIRRQEA